MPRSSVLALPADERGLGGGQYETVAVPVLVEVQPIHLVGEFGELSRAVTAGIVELMRGQDEFVTVFKVFLDEIVEERPFQTRAVSAVNPESVAAQFDAALVVDEPQRSAKVDMVLDGEREDGRLAEHSHHLIVLLFAGEQIGVGNVGQTGQEIAYPLFERGDSLVAAGNLVADCAHFLEDVVDGFARLLERGNLRGHFVAARLELFDVGDEFLALVVPRQKQRKIYLTTFLEKRRRHFGGILPYSVDVEHLFFLRRPRAASTI